MRPLNGQRISGPVGHALAGTLVVFAAGFLPMTRCVAQSQAPTPSNVIQVLVQTDPNMTAFEVGDKFITARDSTPGFNFIEHTVDPVDPESYVLISSLIRRGTLKTTPIEADPTGILIEPLKGQDGAWSVDLRDPTKFLESAKITVLDVETRQEESLSLEVAPRTQDRAALRFHSPGTYILRLERGKHPRSATLRVAVEKTNGDLGVAEDVIIGWPDLGRCYLVTLKGTRGDEQLLFDSLKDPRKVANPIKDLFDAKVTLIVGSFLEKNPPRPPGIVTIKYPKPENTDPRRLWMRFPLTEAEEKAVREELDLQLKPEDGYKHLPAWIASKKLEKDQKLAPGTDRWIEVPWAPEANGFQIEVRIDTKAWQTLLTSSPDKVGERAILVWEFENPTKPDERSAIKVGGKWYQAERVGWWRSSLPTTSEQNQ